MCMSQHSHSPRTMCLTAPEGPAGAHDGSVRHQPACPPAGSSRMLCAPTVQPAAWCASRTPVPPAEPSACWLSGTACAACMRAGGRAHAQRVRPRSAAAAAHCCAVLGCKQAPQPQSRCCAWPASKRRKVRAQQLPQRGRAAATCAGHAPVWVPGHGLPHVVGILWGDPRIVVQHRAVHAVAKALVHLRRTQSPRGNAPAPAVSSCARAVAD